MRQPLVHKKKSPLVKLYLLPPIFKLLLCLSLVVVSCVVGFSWMVKEAKSEARQIDIQKQRVEAEVVNEAKHYGELSYLSKVAVNAKQQYETLVKSFPPESSVGDLLASITQLGTAEGLKFVYFRPLAGKSYDYYAAVPVDISVVGKFHQLAKFLSGLANLPGSVVAVNQFRMVHNDRLSSDQLTLEFTATVYHALPNSLDVKI